MKATGIVRSVDKLGRFVIPKELRNILGIEIGDPLEVYTEGNRIILKRYEKACVLCGGERNNTDVKGRPICCDCLTEIKCL